MSRHFHALLAVVLHLAVAVPIPFCRAENIPPRATNVTAGNVVPACAQGCLASFIESDFPTAACQNARDLSCLCTRRSTAGFTLGEATTTTTTTTTTEAQRTHSTTLAEPTPSPTSNSSISLTSTMVKPTSSSTSIALHSAPLPSSTLVSTSILWFPQPTGLPPEPSESPAVEDAHPMTSAQVIGISIGGAAAGALLLALIIMFCLKRRRNKVMTAHESGFEIGGQMSEPSPPDFLVGYRGDRALRSPIGIYNEPVARRLTLPANNASQPAGAASDARNAPFSYPAYSQRDSDDASLSTPNAPPKSKSPRRLSQLLPEKPNYEAFSSQDPIAEPIRRRPESAATLFEEEDNEDRRALAATNTQRPPTHPSDGYDRMSVNASRNQSQNKQYGPQYAAHQNNGRQQQPQQQQRQRQRQPPTLRLVTPASSSSYHARTNMTMSPPKVTYQRMDYGSSMRPNGIAPSGHLNSYSQAGAGAWPHRGPIDQSRRRSNDRTLTGSVTGPESVESNVGSRTRNGGSATKRSSARLSPVRERSTSPDPNAYPKPLSIPLKYPPMTGPSAPHNNNFQGKDPSERCNDMSTSGGANGSKSRLYSYPYHHQHPYQHRLHNTSGGASNVPKFPKFHQPLRLPMRLQPPPHTRNQQPQHHYPSYTSYTKGPHNNCTSSNISSSDSLLSKRRGETTANKMESELDVNKASGLRPSPLNSANKSGAGDLGATQGVLETPSPSLAFREWQERQAQQQRRWDRG
ncbi:predicted protein [Histoplasma capsulatum G186AR]|uniref:Extracellular membrane protein CFEM domain-containing protein n=1 Tax=Ajellomyces capsulatus (strain G186AR / H82 / ATCC MYA-2454 / RMSCC 2432) TaxID=447093 RepID=C0NI17_AJECG|nr:uncharacterized protein HCBG_02989 [Histoplasma capsulatum G186AR]EEH09452.1 predicted protein [Histoplasma capsulatum G186AR]